jgi:hypothetical protein
MPQIKKSYSEVAVPFTKMTFTPDVPSSALGANEYNAGENVETDVRGIRSVSGETEILQTVPGEPIFVTGGFRQGGKWYFIVALKGGAWYMNDGTGWDLITPPSPYVGTAYDQDTNITESWNGTVVIFNDTINPPFFLPDEANTNLVNYKNNITAVNITTIGALAGGQRTITVATAYATAPFVAGDKIAITMTSGPTAFTGVYKVASSTTTQITYYTNDATAWSGAGTVNAAYIWNYNPEWKSLTAGFIRIYSTPNVGNILVAGNLLTIDQSDILRQYPITVQWSQAFGLNSAPRTWEPTLQNVANQVEVPLRGRAQDAFFSNGQLFISSYWDTAVLTPMNYATTSAPILGIRLFNQGRGLLNANTWANSDDMVYGVDSRDIWAFNGQTFVGIGNQRVKHWFFDQLDPQYASRVYMDINTEKNQMEIYYPDKNASNGVPNKMLSYRYDLDCWNAPRDVSKAAFTCESPVWYDTETYTKLNPTNITGAGTNLEVTITKNASSYALTAITIAGTGYAIGNTSKILGTSLGGATPANDLTLTVTAISGSGGVTAATVTGTVVDWIFNRASRTIVYCKGDTGKKLIMKDYGYLFVDDEPINATFRRDNIKLLKDYSSKTLVHRILPEAVNLNSNNVEIDPTVNPELVGNIEVTVEGANSVGQAPQQVTGEVMSTDTDYPWIQINQNAHRVNSIEIKNPTGVTTATPGTIWMVNSITWQFTETEDDR